MDCQKGGGEGDHAPSDAWLLQVAEQPHPSQNAGGPIGDPGNPERPGPITRTRWPGFRR